MSEDWCFTSHLWPWVSCHSLVSSTGRSFLKRPEMYFSARVFIAILLYDRMEVQVERTWNIFDQSLPSPMEKNHSVASALPWGRKTNKQVEHETSKETERKSGLLEMSPKSLPPHMCLSHGEGAGRRLVWAWAVCASVLPLDVGMCVHVVSVEYLD